MLGPNLIHNPDCILSLGEWGSGSLGPDDWISFSCDNPIASQQSVITEAGNYKLVLIYESDGPFRAIVGNAPYQLVPACSGGVFAGNFTVTAPASDAIMFSDRTESVTGRILRAELRKVTAAA